MGLETFYGNTPVCHSFFILWLDIVVLTYMSRCFWLLSLCNTGIDCMHHRHWMLQWSSSRCRLLTWHACSSQLMMMLVKSCAWAASQRSVLLPLS